MNVNFLKKNIISIFSRLGFDIRRKSKTDDFLLKVNSNSIARFFYLKRMFDKISDVKGDIVECGVGMAGTFQILALLVEQERGGIRKLFGFDSFRGFPQPTAEDISPRNPKKGEWNYLTIEEAREVLFKCEIDPQFLESQIYLIDGFFAETLPKYKDKISSIALLHLDVDLYRSYKECLEHLFPKVVKGGVVLFDEYIGEEHNWPGAKKAIDEYFQGTKYKIQRDDQYNKYFLIKA